MPTIQGLELPKPKNWQDFESIVRDAMSQLWKSPGLRKNGRPGQKQNGIDIYGEDEIGRRVGIQCKNTREKLGLKLVEKEIAKAETFEGELTTLFIAASLEYDTKIQKDVRLLSDKRVAAGKFSVSLIFWEDVVNGLILNPEVFNSHFSQVNLPTLSSTDHERQLAAMELGYYGAEIWSYVDLTFGDIGWMTQADPDDLMAVLKVLERRASQLLSPADASPILKSLAEMQTGCLAEKADKTDWDPVEVHAKRVQTRINAASSLLPPNEAKTLELAMQLARIYHNCDDPPSSGQQKEIEAKVKSILPGESAKKIRAKFKGALEISAGYNWAQRIFNLIVHELRWASH